MRCKRRAFTLIEVMVSLLLLALLLGSVGSFFRVFVGGHQEERELWEFLVEERRVDFQLETLFSHILQEGPFFTNEQGLFFTYDHGPDREPELSHAVSARLHFDPHQESLCLTIWPSKGLQPIRTTTLCSHVKHLDISFYAPPNPFKLSVEPQRVGQPLPEGRVSAWEKSYSVFPALVTIELVRSFGEREVKELFSYDLGIRKIILPQEVRQ